MAFDEQGIVFSTRLGAEEIAAHPTPKMGDHFGNASVEPVAEMGPGMQQQLAAVMNPEEPITVPKEQQPQLMADCDAASLMQGIRPSPGDSLFGACCDLGEEVISTAQDHLGHQPQDPQVQPNQPAPTDPGALDPNNNIHTAAAANFTKDFSMKPPGQFG